MSLLTEIRDDAVNSQIELSVVLRKAKILAVKLSNEPFKKWVDQELNGYAATAELPEYRILQVESRGKFVGNLGSGMDNAHIPISVLPERIRPLVRNVYMRDPISYYADLVKSDNQENVESPWPAEWLPLLTNKVYASMECIGAWRLIPRGAVVALLDSVRNKLLNFVLEIETVAPDAGERTPPPSQLSSDGITQVFNTQIWGSNVNMAQASPGSTQRISVEIVKGDFESLSKYLASLGIQAADLKELEAAIKQDEAPTSADHLGQRVSNWIGKMIAKAASGAWDIGLTAAGTLLLKAIAKYYGIDVN
jgi:hypothetical protein